MKATVAAVGVCGVLGLGACGGDDESASTSVASATSTTTTTASAAAFGEITRLGGAKPKPDVRAGSVQQALPERVNELTLRKVGELPALLDAGALDAVVASYTRYDEAGVIVLDEVRHELAVFSSPEKAESWRQEVVDYVTRSGVPDAGYAVKGEEPVTSPDGSDAGTVTLLHRKPSDYTLLWTNGPVYGAIDGFFQEKELVVGVYNDLPY